MPVLYFITHNLIHEPFHYYEYLGDLHYPYKSTTDIASNGANSIPNENIGCVHILLWLVFEIDFDKADICYCKTYFQSLVLVGFLKFVNSTIIDTLEGRKQRPQSL